MKETIPFLLILLMITNVFGEESKTKKFEESIQAIQSAHTKLHESMMDDTIQDRTKPMLFNLGMSLIYEEIKIMDPQDKRTQGFKDEHNRIIGNVKDINGYLEIYYDEVMDLIRSYRKEETESSNTFNHTKKKIGKLYWQMGKASTWEDCPINPGYSEIHGETLCATDGPTAEKYCKNMKGRLPTAKEFIAAEKMDESISKDSRWPKYWTSDKKKGLHLSITIPIKLKNYPTKFQMKPLLQTDSAASIRCVWDKK